LVPPRKFIGSVFSGRLPRGKGYDGWWPSSSAEVALRSVEEVGEKFESFALPIFEQTSTLAGYVEALKQRSAGVSNPHFKGDIGAALACDKRLDEARYYLEAAENEYRAGLREMPTAEWMADCANNMRALQQAIATGEHHTILERWFRESTIALKIDKKWKI